MLFLHTKSDAEFSGEDTEDPFGWVTDWGDADLSTPPPDCGEKWCQGHLLMESDGAANLIMQQVPSAHPGHLIILINKKKPRSNDGLMKTQKHGCNFLHCLLPLTRTSTPSRSNLLFPLFPYPTLQVSCSKDKMVVFCLFVF